MLSWLVDIFLNGRGSTKMYSYYSTGYYRCPICQYPSGNCFCSPPFLGGAANYKYFSDSIPSYPLRHPLSEKFHSYLKEVGDLHDRKQLDYGTSDSPFANVESSEDFGVKPWVAALVRANDKMRRLQKLARGGLLSNETAEDSFKDLAVYALIALVLYEDEQITEK